MEILDLGSEARGDGTEYARRCNGLKVFRTLLWADSVDTNIPLPLCGLQPATWRLWQLSYVQLV